MKPIQAGILNGDEHLIAGCDICQRNDAFFRALFAVRVLTALARSCVVAAFGSAKRRIGKNAETIRSCTLGQAHMHRIESKPVDPALQLQYNRRNAIDLPCACS